MLQKMGSKDPEESYADPWIIFQTAWWGGDGFSMYMRKCFENILWENQKIHLQTFLRKKNSVHRTTLEKYFLIYFSQTKRAQRVNKHIVAARLLSIRLCVLQEVNRQMIDNSNLRSRPDLLFAFCLVELAYSRG
jgi:hypothetical protein